MGQLVHIWKSSKSNFLFYEHPACSLKMTQRWLVTDSPAIVAEQKERANQFNSGPKEEVRTKYLLGALG